MTKSKEQEAPNDLDDAAQPLAGPHSAELRGRAAQAGIGLAALDGQRVRVKLLIGGKSRIVTGRADYQAPSGLAILLEDEFGTEIHIAEASWNGRILQEVHEASGFLIALDAAAAASPQPAG